MTPKVPNVPSYTAKHDIICRKTESSSPVQCSSPVNRDTLMIVHINADAVHVLALRVCYAKSVLPSYSVDESIFKRYQLFASLCQSRTLALPPTCMYNTCCPLPINQWCFMRACTLWLHKKCCFYHALCICLWKHRRSRHQSYIYCRTLFKLHTSNVVTN